MTTTFKIGDKVKWQSQANGGWTEKKGIIIAVVPIKGKPADVLPDYAGSKYRTTIDPRSLGCRQHQSYVVLVDGKTDKATPIMYWPVVSRLQRV